MQTLDILLNGALPVTFSPWLPHNLMVHVVTIVQIALCQLFIDGSAESAQKALPDPLAAGGW